MTKVKSEWKLDLEIDREIEKLYYFTLRRPPHNGESYNHFNRACREMIENVEKIKNNG